MSFSWKGLLGVGAGGGNAVIGSGHDRHSGNPLSELDQYAGVIGLDQQGARWEAENLADVPNMLGMQNFGNTCYVNSVIQALYYCRPFRESLLAYTSTLQVADLAQTPAQSDPGPSRPAQLSSKAAETETFFLALQKLFIQMTTAKVTPPAQPVATAPKSIPISTSYLGSGLSRKGSSKPVTNVKPSSGGGFGSTIPSAMMAAPGVLPPHAASNSSAASTSKAASSCSNILVQDDDIKGFIGRLKKSNLLFDSTAHQDAHELLNFVLNRIGEDVQEEAKGIGPSKTTKLKDDSSVRVMDISPGGRTWVHRVFEGTLTNETRCLTCETVTSRDESFLDLSIDIERNSSITSCLRQFSASEMLCARNKFFCDTCSGLQEAEKRMKIKKLPNVLALHLKRFKYEEAVQKFVKLAYRVVFPFELRLSNTSDDAEDPDKLYELYGIIVHIGVGPHHGHYIAIVKVGLRWFVFDDETISVIDQADICRYYGDTPGAGCAYVLFYQAKELDIAQLGLTDKRGERQIARMKAEEALWDQYQRARDGITTPDGSAVLKIDTLRPPMIMSPPVLASPTTSESMVGNDTKSSAAMSPTLSSSSAGGITSSAAGFFSRKHNHAPLPPPPALSLANHNTTSSHQNEPNEGKGSSWFNSLRPGAARKGSMNNLLSVTASNGASSKHAMTPSPSKAGREDTETESTSTTDAAVSDDKDGHRLATPKSTAASDAVAPPFGSEYDSPSKKGSRSAAVTPSKSPHQQGATWAPADRPLSKKEQEKIARQSRRGSASLTASLLPDPPLPALPSKYGQLSEQGGAKHSDGMSVEEHPTTTTEGANSWGRRSGHSQGQSTTDTHAEATPLGRRRTTLSKAFGLGRRSDKEKA